LNASVGTLDPPIDRAAPAPFIAPRARLIFLARLLLCLPFIISGLAKLFAFDDATAEVRSLTGLEPAPFLAALLIARSSAVPPRSWPAAALPGAARRRWPASPLWRRCLSTASGTKPARTGCAASTSVWKQIGLIRRPHPCRPDRSANATLAMRTRARPACIGVAAVLAAASPALAGTSPEPPPFAGLRFEEDWRPYCAGATGDPAFMPTKCIGLGKNTLLSLGGELRLRGEAVDNPDLGLGPAHDGALLARALLHADLRVGSTVRLFAQFGSIFAAGRASGDGPTDEDRLDLMQGFVDLSAPVTGGEATLRAGRQELALGSSRLVSVRESPNVRRSFDGLRGLWRAGETRLDLLYLQPVSLRRGVFDDRSDDGQALWGAYLTIPLATAREAGVDLYYLGYRRSDAVFAEGVARERRHSLGARLFGRSGALDWDIEAVRQFGSFGGDDIDAWTIASDVGWTFADLTWSPRVGLKADLASGDRRPGDGKLGTFDALYPKLPYLPKRAWSRPPISWTCTRPSRQRRQTLWS
jgi:hypothetical protein